MALSSPGCAQMAGTDQSMPGFHHPAWEASNQAFLPLEKQEQQDQTHKNYREDTGHTDLAPGPRHKLPSWELHAALVRTSRPGLRMSGLCSAQRKKQASSMSQPSTPGVQTNRPRRPASLAQCYQNGLQPGDSASGSRAAPRIRRSPHPPNSVYPPEPPRLCGALDSE